MKTVTLRVDDSIFDKIIWLLSQFSRDKVEIVDSDISDDNYLRNIGGMVDSIKEARSEPTKNGVTLDKLDW